MPDRPQTTEERVAITDFRFKVCGRCGHPPSDGPCIMGNAEHAEVYEHAYASYAVVRELAAALEAERERANREHQGWEEQAHEVQRELAARAERAEQALGKTTTVKRDDWYAVYKRAEAAEARLREAERLLREADYDSDRLAALYMPDGWFARIRAFLSSSPEPDES